MIGVNINGQVSLITLMTNHNLDNQLAAETIRQLEQQGMLSGMDAINTRLAGESISFETKIIKRAQWLAEKNGISSLLHRVKSMLCWLMISLCLLFLVLGALGALNAFDQLDNGIANFYWLIIVLLGFNLVALLLWMSALCLPSAKSSSLLSTVLGSMKNLVGWLLFRQQREYLVLETVFNRLFSGATGRWALSRLTHSLWCCYLAGGIVVMMLILSTRQYDFAWATTILGEFAFVNLTELMAKLPQSLGFNVPDAQQIAQSRLGVLSASGDAALRQAWASLLMASLLLYGLVPRLLLLAISQLLYRRVANRHQLDLASAYYLHLKTQLMPEARQLGVQDGIQQGSNDSGEIINGDLGCSLPAQAYYCGLEVDPDSRWLPPGVAQQNNLGVIDSRSSQQRLLDILRQNPQQALVVIVPVRRSADRGMERYLSELTATNRSDLFLGLNGAILDAESELDIRMADWVQLGRRAGIAADHIVPLTTEGSRA